MAVVPTMIFFFPDLQRESIGANPKIKCECYQDEMKCSYEVEAAPFLEVMTVSPRTGEERAELRAAGDYLPIFLSLVAEVDKNKVHTFPYYEENKNA